MNKLSNPSTCQSGKEEREGSEVFSGKGVTKTAVADGSICGVIDVADGVSVFVDVGRGVRVDVAEDVTLGVNVALGVKVEVGVNV